MDQAPAPPPGLSTVRRRSSRLENLGHSFLRDQLRGAVSYDRLAGYFRSSVFEVVGEEIEAVAGKVRIVCNGDLSARDVLTARAAVAAVTRKWMETPPEVDTLLHRARYRRLHDLLRSGKLEVRVLPQGRSPFLHGKAGVIRRADGGAVAFMGSVNETDQGWTHNYEILWEDASDEAVRWVEEEFRALWDVGIPLPDTVVTEVGRVAARSEYASVEEWRGRALAGPAPLGPDAAAAAAIVEAPVYRAGECLYPWQKNFVSMVLRHRQRHGKARLLLADEVGLGKTMSLGAAALLTALLGDGPVLLLVPATLTLQWQTELWDRLGIPSAVWTRDKCWVDHKGHAVPGNGDPANVARCPYLIGIVSTGLVVQPTREREALLNRPGHYGCVILDEAHKARREDLKDRSPRGPGNNLLEFMREVAPRAENVLLGTATPIQVDPIELWDLMDVLGRGADHVLGDRHSRWRLAPAEALDHVLGREEVPDDPLARFELVANPLPPPGERPAALFEAIRSDLGLPDNAVSAKGRFKDTSPATRDALDTDFAEAMRWSNPFVLHTVLRKRSMIENRIDPQTGDLYIRRVSVAAHPPASLTDADFSQGALRMPLVFREAYDEAARFCDLVGQRVKGGGFLKTILLRRIGSTVEAGLATARKMLGEGDGDDDEGDAPATDEAREQLRNLTADERSALEVVVRRLSGLVQEPDGDPKGRMVARYLAEGAPGSASPWLAHGCIVFSQFYDSAHWLARRLASLLPDERVGLYGGGGRSLVLHEGDAVKLDRDAIKAEVARGGIRLLIATDAACEGLNLQALGTLVNLDLPWNPAKLEQRKGRIQRIGQARDTVDVLNLRYADSVEDRVFDALSSRFQNIWDMFGQFPDALEDDWTQAILRSREEARKFIAGVRPTNQFDLRYQSSVEGSDWEGCAKVLARADILAAMSRSW